MRLILPSPCSSWVNHFTMLCGSLCCTLAIIDVAPLWTLRPRRLLFFLYSMMKTWTVFFQRSSTTTNLSRFKDSDEIDPAVDHWVAKELRRHRWQSCVCNEPFTLGGNYVLPISDNDLGSKQKPCSRVIETLRYGELLTNCPIPNSSNQ